MNNNYNRFLRNAHIFARLVEQVLERGYLREANGAKLTFDQINLLKFLCRPGPNNIGDVARFLNASYAAASKAVTRLEKKGVLRSKISKRDRRAQELMVTPRGHALIRNYEETKSSRLAALFGSDNPDTLAQGLEKAVAVLIRERSVAGNPCLGCGAYYADECVVRLHNQTCPCQR
ncbi:MAG: winged helix-turn-helix transcriptional regulator [Planctomycetes bacterium]|nr:winged helix-turn-helix transcriptional regulator [Planctomycetota bacterium]